MKTAKKKLRDLFALLGESTKVYTEHEMSVYAGYTTLYILMAMVPLLTLMIGVVNLLPDMSLQHLEKALRDILPDVPEVRSTLHAIIANVNRQAGSLAVSVSLIVSLWSASNGVNALQRALRKLYGTGGSFLRERGKALLYTLLFLALIPAMFIFRVLRGSIEQLIVLVNRWLNIPDVAGRLLNVIEYSGFITACVMVLVILLAYTYLPGGKHRLGDQLPGALFTTLLWLAFSSLFELFIQRFWQASSLYGSLASVFLAAMWLKSIVMILFYGAALNKVLQERKSKKSSLPQNTLSS